MGEFKMQKQQQLMRGLQQDQETCKRRDAFSISSMQKDNVKGTMSKTSNKRLKQLLNWISNELQFGKGTTRIRNSKGHYIKNN